MRRAPKRSPIQPPSGPVVISTSQRSARRIAVASTGATQVIESFIRKESVSRNTPSPVKPSVKPQISSRCGTGSRKGFLSAISRGRRGSNRAAASEISVNPPKIRNTECGPTCRTIQAPPTSDRACTKPIAARLAPTRLPALARSLTA